MNLGVIGAGYVGLTTAICLASLNHTMTIFEISKERIQHIKNKKIPFYEEGLQELLEKTISFDKLRVADNVDQLVKNTDGCFICVGTPNKNNSIDLSQIIESIKSVANSIKNNKKNNYVIIIRSTVIPTTTRHKIFPVLKEILGKHDFGLCVVPEFLREGKALDDFMNPGKIIIGSVDEKSKLFVNNIFDNFKNKVIINTNPETAELIKYTSNSFFSLLISFSNEIANISEKIPGVDSYEVLRALIHDKRIMTIANGKKITPNLTSYLLPGCGFGGSCLPKDVQAIFQYASSNEIKTPLLNAILEINDERPNKIISLAESILGILKEKKISILGLTFKPDTDDIRSSPAISAIKIFQEKGARISAYDPMISKKNSQETKNFDFSLCTTLEECLQSSELAILFTKWSEFSSIDGNLLKKYMKNPIIIDGRGFLDKNNFEENSYYKLGYVK